VMPPTLSMSAWPSAPRPRRRRIHRVSPVCPPRRHQPAADVDPIGREDLGDEATVLDHLAAHLDPGYEDLGQRHRAARDLLAAPPERLVKFERVDTATARNRHLIFPARLRRGLAMLLWRHAPSWLRLLRPCLRPLGLAFRHPSHVRHSGELLGRRAPRQPRLDEALDDQRALGGRGGHELAGEGEVELG
jgi:hypothetical protein